MERENRREGSGYKRGGFFFFKKRADMILDCGPAFLGFMEVYVRGRGRGGGLVKREVSEQQVKG